MGHIVRDGNSFIGAPGDHGAGVVAAEEGRVVFVGGVGASVDAAGQVVCANAEVSVAFVFAGRVGATMVRAEVGGCLGVFVGAGRGAGAVLGFAFAVPGAEAVGWVAGVDAEGDRLIAWCLAGVFLAVVGVDSVAVREGVVAPFPEAAGEEAVSAGVAVDGHCAIPPWASLAGRSCGTDVDDLNSSHVDRVDSGSS